MNGGANEPVDGVALIRSTATTSMPLFSQIIPQSSVIVSNVTANVNVHSFQPAFQVYSNNVEPPQDSHNSVLRRQRSNKVVKRSDSQGRRGVDSPHGNFTSQHQFSPTAPPYIPAQVSSNYHQYYTHQTPTGIPSPAIPGNPVFITTPQIQFQAPLNPLVINTAYPPGAVYPTPSHVIEQDIKETVPYPPQQSQDQEPVAVSMPGPVHPVVQAPSNPIPPLVTPEVPPVIETESVTEINKEEDEEDTPVVSAVIENSKMNRSIVNAVQNEENERVKSPVPIMGNGIKTVVTSTQGTLPVSKPPFQSKRDRKPSLGEEPNTPAPKESPLVTVNHQSTVTWASLLKGPASSDCDKKPTVAVKPTMQTPSPSAAIVNNFGGSPAISTNKTPLSASRKSTSGFNSSKSLPAPCIADDPRLVELGSKCLSFFINLMYVFQISSSVF